MQSDIKRLQAKIKGLESKLIEPQEPYKRTDNSLKTNGIKTL